MKTSLALVIAFLAGVTALAAEPAAHELASPNGQLRFVLSLTTAGEPTYAITGARGPLILPSTLGLVANADGNLTPDWLRAARRLKTSDMKIARCIAGNSYSIHS